MKENFKQVRPEVDYPGLEKEILEYWKKNNVYETIQKLRKKGKERFSWLEGPPTANGVPHAGHALTRILKDITLRYQTMKGKWVRPRIGGWDTHGLPVEIEVEKKLGLKTKGDIIEYGIEKFNAKCRESVLEFEKEWVEMSERVGFWLNMDKSYITMKESYIESVWWSLKTIYEKKLLYKGLRVAPLCIRCETTLSSHELAQGYKEIVEPAIFVKFKAINFDFSFLAWTTTPWTLLSNVMLSVNPNFEYVVVEEKGEMFLLAKDLVEKVFEKKKKILKTYKGTDLEYIKYTPLFPYFSHLSENAFFVTLADYVSLEEGTGIVHSAPAFGSDDAEVGKRYDVSVIQCVDIKGNFTNEVPLLEGMYVKDADKKIIEVLKEQGQLFKKENYKHNYPHCWRCDTSLLYYGTESWFIAMSKLRENLIKNNDSISWQPDFIKHGRFGNFLENAVDWNLSRSRFWGTPLPIWQCDKCETIEIIGSKMELQMKTRLPKDFDLHRPWVDNVFWSCNKCEGKMIREPYVIDVWYDSGCASFAQYHYPFENVEEFESDFPFSWITEAIDQTRGWFYSLLAISTALFDKPAYKTILCVDHILDSKGQKMSKSKGNTINTKNLFEKVGADAIRWYLSSSQAWVSSKFDLTIVQESQKKMMNTLWNIYSFFVTNARLDKYFPTKFTNVKERHVLDRWALSRLQNIIEVCILNCDAVSYHTVVRVLDTFIMTELSNWYVRRSRRRFYFDKLTTDKKYAYDTFYEILTTLCKLLAPFIPFLAETIFLNLTQSMKNNVFSVHAELYPKIDEARIDKKLEKQMQLFLTIATAGRVARANVNIKVRQPLSILYAVVPEKPEDIDNLLYILKEELNVKEIRFLTPTKTLSQYKLHPNYKVLAPQVKGEINTIRDYLKNMTSDESFRISEELQTTGKFDLLINNKIWKINKNSVILEPIAPKGYKMGSFGGIDVFLATELTQELKEEGIARELIRWIQEMRKVAKLEYHDRIYVNVKTEADFVKKAICTHKDHIMKETQSDTVSKKNLEPQLQKKWEADTFTVIIEIKKA